jgi:hypothetical protein
MLRASLSGHGGRGGGWNVYKFLVACSPAADFVHFDKKVSLDLLDILPACCAVQFCSTCFFVQPNKTSLT